MNLLHGTALVALIGIFIMIPAAPGYWGLYEAGGIFSLVAMGVTQDQSLALAYTLMIHLVQYVPLVAIGLYYAVRSQVRPSAASAEGSEGQGVSGQFAESSPSGPGAFRHAIGLICSARNKSVRTETRNASKRSSTAPPRPVDKRNDRLAGALLQSCHVL